MIRFTIFLLVCFLFSCTDHAAEFDEQLNECSTENYVTEKQTARMLILGKWEWMHSKTSSRGFPTTFETPESTHTTVTYKFLPDMVKIFTDGMLTAEHPYKIQFEGEGTSSVDPVLVVKIGTRDGVIYGTEDWLGLLLSPSGTCLTFFDASRITTSNFRKTEAGPIIGK